jgi:lipid-binding SYLF domain-containing protein
MGRTIGTRLLTVGLVALAIGFAPKLSHAQVTSDEEKLIADSITALENLTAGADDRIPQHLLARAEAIVIVPSLIKGGFVIGAKHGRGVISVREHSGLWSNPAFITLTGASIGWQIGVESVDLVLLVMNRDGIDELLGNKFTLGGNLSLAAGPLGRSADAGTDAELSAKILAYSRAKGLFAGASLEGASLRGDEDANRNYYGSGLGLKELLLSAPRPTSPGSATNFRNALQAHAAAAAVPSPR